MREIWAGLKSGYHAVFFGKFDVLLISIRRKRLDNI